MPCVDDTYLKVGQRRAVRGLALVHARRYDESIDSLRQVLALDDRFDLARSFLVRALLAKGKSSRTPRRSRDTVY